MNTGLVILAYLMIITFLALIMSKKITPMTGLALVPIVFVIIGMVFRLFPESYSLGDIATMIADGIESTSQTAVMLMFAILYFSLMMDVGLFDPIIKVLIRYSKGDPVKILLGTALVTGLVSMDGD